MCFRRLLAIGFKVIYQHLRYLSTLRVWLQFFYIKNDNITVQMVD